MKEADLEAIDLAVVARYQYEEGTFLRHLQDEKVADYVPRLVSEVRRLRGTPETHALVGKVVEWRHGRNRLIGEATRFDPEDDELFIVPDGLVHGHYWVPVAECAEYSPAPIGHGLPVSNPTPAGTPKPACGSRGRE